MEDVIGCAALAEEMVRKLEEDGGGSKGEGEGDGMRPDVTSYGIVVKAWSRATASLAEGRGRGTIRNTIGTDLTDLNVYSARDAAERATYVVTDLTKRYLRGEISESLRPDVSVYNFAVEAWAKSRAEDASRRAEELLDEMMDLSQGRGETADGDNAVVNDDASLWESVRPDTATYNGVIEAWAHSPDPRGLEKARDTLDDMERRFADTSDLRIRPNIRTYNQVIKAYALKGAEVIRGGKLEGGFDRERAWTAAKKAERLLNAAEERHERTGDDYIRPDASTYTSCCDAYSRVGDVVASERAEALLERMEQRYNETGDDAVRPNFRTYTAVIAAWSKTSDESSPRRAERLLRRMELLHAATVRSGAKVSKDRSVKPNVRTYTTVINAWVRSRDEDRHQRALAVLKKMLDLANKGGDESARPNVYAYNAVMEACSKCRGTGDQQAQALRVAFAVNKALLQAASRTGSSVEPNHLTYAALMKCAQKLMPAGKERNDVARAVFQRCVKAGMVDTNVLRQLQMASDREEFYDLCKPLLDVKGRVQFDDLPSDWNKNVLK